MEYFLQQEERLEAERLKPTGVPHSFFLDDFLIPRTCDHCRKIMWGLNKQGYRCAGTNNPLSLETHIQRGSLSIA